MSSRILTNPFRMEFTLEWPKKCFSMLRFNILVDLKKFHWARISSESENELEEKFSFTLCGHAASFNVERMLLVNEELIYHLNEIMHNCNGNLF